MPPLRTENSKKERKKGAKQRQKKRSGGTGPGLKGVQAQDAAMARKVQKVAYAWSRICPLVYFLLQLQGSQAKCYFQAKAPCHYEGKQFTLGESWLGPNCLLCTCLHPVGVGCCEITQHPIDFPDWCEVHYDAQTCQISVVQKANPSLPCVNSMEHEWGSAGAPEPVINKVLGTRLNR